MIEIKNISFGYDKEGEQKALRDINLAVHRGEWLAVLGANGSGKSTLAQHLNGLLLPDQGQVLVEGLDTKDANNILQVRQKVAFVLQNPENQIVGTSVEEDIAFGPENLGLAPEEIGKRVEMSLSFTGLQEQRKKEPHLLSGGQKQLLAIAGALAMSPHYLLLDEPTSMLDPRMRRQIIEVLKYLQQQLSMGIIYITNMMEDILWADRVAVLQAGRLMAVGASKQIFADPRQVCAWGLSLPAIGRLSAMLAEAGHQQLGGIYDSDEMVEALCK
jgi:energy-coupling factor transport system ATP-binding protein